MTPFADLHCHLLAGLDDGPRTWDDAVAMCRLAAEDGVGAVAAVCHQSERWAVSPDAIRAAVVELRRRLEEASVPLAVFPSAEVMSTPDLVGDWESGRLLSVGDKGRYVLVEMPNRLFVDLRPTIRSLGEKGVRVILAHPERHPELLHDAGRLEELVRMKCAVQVNAESVTDPKSDADAKALRSWFRRGCVHLIASDGHSPRKRRPVMAAAVRRVREWAGPEVAERVASRNGHAILRGEKLPVVAPAAERHWWPLRLFAS